MLFDLATLLIILLASVGVVLVISVVNLFRNESWSYSVNDGNVRLIGHMKKDSDSGSAQFMVPDDPSEPAIGHVQFLRNILARHTRIEHPDCFSSFIHAHDTFRVRVFLKWPVWFCPNLPEAGLETCSGQTLDCVIRQVLPIPDQY